MEYGPNSPYKHFPDSVLSEVAKNFASNRKPFQSNFYSRNGGGRCLFLYFLYRAWRMTAPKKFDFVSFRWQIVIFFLQRDFRRLCVCPLKPSDDSISCEKILCMCSGGIPSHRPLLEKRRPAGEISRLSLFLPFAVVTGGRRFWSMAKEGKKEKRPAKQGRIKAENGPKNVPLGRLLLGPPETFFARWTWGFFAIFCQGLFLRPLSKWREEQRAEESYTFNYEKKSLSETFFPAESSAIKYQKIPKLNMKRPWPLRRVILKVW